MIFLDFIKSFCWGTGQRGNNKSAQNRADLRPDCAKQRHNMSELTTQHASGVPLANPKTTFSLQKADISVHI